MPELPEVETIKNDLAKSLVGMRITGLWWDSPKQLKPSPQMVEDNIIGTTIEKIERRAKIIQFFLSNQKILIVHLKLTGRLLIRDRKEPADKWAHIILRLSDNLDLRFCDMRKFGYLRIMSDEKELDEVLKEFGPEPFTPEFTVEKFKKILSVFSLPIKILLMDQKKIAGVGNIYANEALFLAGINPRIQANTLSNGQMVQLFHCLLKVLTEGIKFRGASDQSYLDAFGREGEYQKHFRVYQQDNKSCPNKCGGKIVRMKLGGRGTFYCPKCQKL